MDSLLGFDSVVEDDHESKGIQALLDKALLTYERLPMLEVIFDRFVRMSSTSLRNFTSDSVDVDIRSITSLRFGDYINSIPMPAMLTIFKALEWDNFGLITIDSSLIYSMVEVLFGGRKSTNPIKIEGRPYTTIEQAAIKYLVEIMLSDMGGAFDPLSPATFQFERMETNPRFATIARPADAAILLQLRIDMEERGGNVEIMFPHATLEPIKELLTQVFMGEKYGKDSTWEAHLAKEIFHTRLGVEAILNYKVASIKEILDLKIGSTIVMNNLVEDDVVLQCQGVQMFSGKLGRVDDHIAVSINKSFNRKRREAL